MVKTSLKSEDFFVVRTPRLSTRTITQLDDDGDKTREAIKEWIDDPHVQEALYLASPSLLSQVNIWKKDPLSKRGQKIEQSLMKYMIRMAARPTPFGLFSGITLGELGEETTMIVGQKEDDERQTRLDMYFLTAVRDYIASNKFRNEKLKIYPNPTHYFIAGECRYIEAYRSSNSWHYRLSTVEVSDYFQFLMTLAQQGYNFDELVKRFVKEYPDAAKEDVESYIEQLIKEYILIPRIPLPIIGKSSDQEFIQAIQTIHEEEFSERLSHILKQIHKQDQSRIAKDEDYRSLFQSIADLPVKAEESKLFQADLKRSFQSCILQHDIPNQIAEVLHILKALGQPNKSVFEDFIKKFQDRYEGQFVRLDKILDDESGIGFSNETGYEAPLLAGLRLGHQVTPYNATGAPLTRMDQFVIDALMDAENAGKDVIHLDKKKIEKLLIGLVPEKAMPASLSAMASIYLDQDNQPVIKLNGSSGPSAANLMGRFCHLDANLQSNVQDHLQKEEGHSSDVIFAEIAHMPEGRIGNVIARPKLRNYEIVFMADSALDSEFQIHLSDLYVWVEGQKVKLWSKKLKKQIIPRLSSAHNYSARSLSAYRFLSMTQSQSGMAGNFSLPFAINRSAFVPRIMLGNIILSEKRWNIDRQDLADILKDQIIDKKKLSEVQSKYNLDDWVAFAAGDNVTYINISNPLMLSVLLSETKRYTSVELKEVLFQALSPITQNVHGSCYNNEFLFPIFNQDALIHQTFKENPAENIETFKQKRSFIPGSEWLSLKVYCGNSSLENLLINQLPTFIKDNHSLFEKWFFIRYGDPEWHLRLRFKGTPGILHGQLLPRLNQMLSPLCDAGQIQKIELFTYEREVERYGGEYCIDQVETIFMADSNLIIKTMALVEEYGEDIRWKVVSITTDQLLSLFNYSESAKLELLTSLRQNFGLEFNEDGDLRKQLGKRYRNIEKSLMGDMKIFNGMTEGELSSLQIALKSMISHWNSEIKTTTTAILDLYNQNQVTCSLDTLLMSIVHMHNNRMFKAYGRQQEFVMHDFLRRYYFSMSKRKTHMNK